VETARSVEGAPWYEVSIADIDDYEGRVWAEGKGALRRRSGCKNLRINRTSSASRGGRYSAAVRLTC
jgi:hypothetical protein